jgi:hypothetical protein
LKISLACLRRGFALPVSLAVENPVIRVRPLDPNAGLVAGDDLGGANNGLAFSASISNRGCERMNMFMSAPSLTLSPNASPNRPRSRSLDSAWIPFR